MIACPEQPRKHFAPPPWDRSSPDWLRLDASLQPDHLARRIHHGVALLDLSPLFDSFSGRGSLACPPALMLKIALFEIQRGRSSPAHWFLDTKENTSLHWLGFGIRPSRSVWYQFAFRIRPFLDRWNQEVLHQAQEHDLLQGQRAALDGTTVEANASRHHLLNHDQLQQRRQTLQEAIAADEHAPLPPPLPGWVAQTPRTRLRQQEQYDAAHAKLSESLAENQKRQPNKRQEVKHVRVSVTDPEAALGKDKQKVFRPLYNVQYVRDLDSPFILGYDTFARGSDTGALVPLMKRTEELTGKKPGELVVDSGYITALDLADAQEISVELYGPWKENDYTDKATRKPKQWGKDQFRWEEGVYYCPAGEKLRKRGVQQRARSLGRKERVELYQAEAEKCAGCELKRQCCPKSKSGRNVQRSEHEELIERHKEKMEGARAKEMYKLRRQTVEPSFGDSKQHRNFRRMNGRGLLKAKGHTGLTVLAHNLWVFAKALAGTASSTRTT